MASTRKSPRIGAKEKKSANSATTRQTAGPGFAFEDLTAAWFLTRILVGEELPGINSDCHKIQSQTGALKWDIDDLLFSALREPATRHLAVSCKSNRQVTGNGFPADFITRAWSLWRNPDSPMNIETDVLALVTRGRNLPGTFDSVWVDIVNWCAGEDTALAISRIREIKKHTRIFESIKLPNETINATDKEVVQLIRHLKVVPLDFQLDSTNSYEEGIGKCRALLRSGDRTEAETVWVHLVQLAEDTRLGSGTLTLEHVWTTLREKFRLKGRPNFEGSWNAVTALSAEYKANIKTVLPSGLTIDRTENKSRLAEIINNQSISLVIGDSGSGKSSIVKTTLDERFPNWNQVWFGPEEFGAATSNLDRLNMGITFPLQEVLGSSVYAENVLVIDSAERLDTTSLSRISQLVQNLVPEEIAICDLSWRIVIISQRESWQDRLLPLVGQFVREPFAVEGIALEDVKSALWANDDLRWLAAREDTIAVLSNLKTLGWVIQASSTFRGEGGEDLTSPAAIADRIWEFWTEGKTSVQNLVMRLGEREAEFERSFAVSEFDGSDAAILDNKPKHLPILRNNRNQIEFEHDLAADWARFQRLKEIAEDYEKWSELAKNPLWSGALRLFGQFLLREKAASTMMWDEAYSVLEENGSTFAADILLDALFLDPQAGTLLECRSEFLFENGGARLKRLLGRFLHIATIPSISPAIGEIDRTLALYVEDRFRTPIIGLWPPMINYLHVHLQEVATLVSPTVAAVCEVWLGSTPPQLEGGSPTPYRKELSELALATARALQVDIGRGVIYIDIPKEMIYSAALAGARDLPDEVAKWALEIAQRRPQDSEVAGRIAEAKAKLAVERAERHKTDDGIREQQRRRARSLSSAISLSGFRKLPPWPMGPSKRVDQDFQKTCLHSPALGPLMHTRPEVVAEIMLALVIEDSPEEEYSVTSSSYDYLGLDYDSGESYPTAFWKSQFFLFLQIAPEIALTALIQLVDFCTERWADQITKGRKQELPQTVLIMANGVKKAFVGDRQVFDWAQENSNSNGQLHCALNALERWLTLEIEQGKNVENYLIRLLQDSTSLAFVGLSINVAKFHPAFFSDVLLPLLSSVDVFWYDRSRVKNAQYNFDAFSWSREHESIFNAAREWATATYRQQELVETVSRLFLKDKKMASFIKSAGNKWNRPSERKAAIEFDILCAQLDETNYQIHEDPESGAVIAEFEYPEELKAEIVAFEQTASSKRSSILLAFQCEKILESEALLDETSAQVLADVLRKVFCCEDEDRQELNKIAAAATLFSNGQKWLENNPEVTELAESVLRHEIGEIGETAEELRHKYSGISNGHLKFAAYGAFHLWLQTEVGEDEWEQAILRILTSGDGDAVRVISFLAYKNRIELGSRWWRLLQLGILWSALTMFRPGYDDSADIEIRWTRWLRWLRTRRISGVPCGAVSIDLQGVWQRLKRMEKDRLVRNSVENPGSHRRPPDDVLSNGLDTGFLDSLFGWLLNEESRSDKKDFEEECEILLALWAYEIAYCNEHRNDEGEFPSLSRFGYNIIGRMAFYAIHATHESSSAIWRSVLDLGPSAHYIVEYFISSWFVQLDNDSDPEAFRKRWREMIEFALAENWIEGRFWFRGQRMVQKLLGFGSEFSLMKLSNSGQVIFEMRDLYEKWASGNLSRDEENVSTFSYFLSSEVGAALRIEGLKWLAAAFEGSGREQHWRDRKGTGSALVNLLDKILIHDASTLMEDKVAREAMMALVAFLVARQVKAALPLQNRLKHLR